MLKFRTVGTAKDTQHMLKVYKTDNKIVSHVHLDFLHGSLEANKREIEAYFARICATHYPNTLFPDTVL
ncbi:MAG: hypothetical protein H7145_03735 [Akkermansiaceae bacterium]|nr:hypothetical protein [Armatimonadota bacterium]